MGSSASAASPGKFRSFRSPDSGRQQHPAGRFVAFLNLVNFPVEFPAHPDRRRPDGGGVRGFEFLIASLFHSAS